jgi:hypothetical protein
LSPLRQRKLLVCAPWVLAEPKRMKR